MRIVVHDYGGHPFQVGLSRQLAERGHDVSHMHYADHPGPKGSFELRPNDPASLRFIGVTLGRSSNHAAGTGEIGLRRLLREVAYGHEVATIMRRLKPDMVLCGNTPPLAQRAIIRTCQQNDIRFIYWVQDIYSVAVTTLLAKKFGMLGKMVGHYFRHLDRSQFQASDAVVAISDDFAPIITPWVTNVPVSVVENWAAIDEIAVGVKDNPWSRKQGLNRGFNYLYCGTMGRKHNPMLLVNLAMACPDDHVIAVSQGYGVPILQTQKRDNQLPLLALLPLQPADQLGNVLATADVLLATIEADAGTFAVPSKVLSYLCAGRPIVMSAAMDNLAARTIRRANAGIVVDPADEAGFLKAAIRLRDDVDLRLEMGQNGRVYAERTFDLTEITDRFEQVFAGACRTIGQPIGAGPINEAVTA